LRHTRLSHRPFALRLVRQARAALPPWAERADRRPRQKLSPQRQNRPAYREIIGRASSRRGNKDAIADKLAEPLLPIDGNRKPCTLRALPEKMHLVDRKRLMHLPRDCLCRHLTRINDPHHGVSTSR